MPLPSCARLRLALEARGIAHAGLFGSVARGEANAASDIDVVVTPAPKKRLDLIDLGSVQTLLDESFAGLDVDVVVEPVRQPDLRRAIQRDRSAMFFFVEREFLREAKTRSAIEHQFLVLSEAAIRLEKLEPGTRGRLAPGIDWPGVRGIGNFIRHKYDDLDTTIIVDVIRNRLDEDSRGLRRRASKTGGVATRAASGGIAIKCVRSGFRSVRLITRHRNLNPVA